MNNEIMPFVNLQKQYIHYKSEIDQAIKDVIEETAFISGKYARLFENEFANVYGVKNCITTANGTDSLYIIMKALEIGVGDEVITVCNSWISSSETISQTGAKPIFVDIEEKTHSINTKLIEENITENTKAILAVHLHGQMCQIDEICKIAKKFDIPVIEDCAQSHFSSLKGVNAGLFGVAGSFSFYPGKNLGAFGDAGCIITNNDELADKMRRFANHGSLKKHEHKIEGINSRMDGIQANILRVKLKYIHEWNTLRQKKADLYSKLLSELNDYISSPVIRKDSNHTFHVYQIETIRRNSLRRHLADNGIPTAIHYPKPLPFLDCYKKYGYNENQFPVVSKLNKNILSLPICPEISDEEIEIVCKTIKGFFK